MSNPYCIRCGEICCRCWQGRSLVIALLLFASMSSAQLPPLPPPLSRATTNRPAGSLAQGAAVAPNNGAISLAWDKSNEAAGYRAYVSTTNSASYNSYSLGNVTNATLGNLVAGGWYRAYVIASDGAGVESLPSNMVEFQAIPAAAKIKTTIRTHIFAIESVGVIGKTNVLQESTNSAGGWVDALVFVGDGSMKGILRTNGGNRFYRTVPR